MKTRQKFFDESGKETTAAKAVSCQEILVDDEGNVVSENLYRVKPEVAGFNRETLEKML